MTPSGENMNEQEFDDTYKPRPNLKERADGSYFNFEHGDICRKVNGEWEIRPELGITDKQVWTIIDCEDDGEMVSAGFHIVNKVAYVITEIPWETGSEDAVWYDGREHYRDTIEDQEGHASFCDSLNWVSAIDHYVITEIPWATGDEVESEQSLPCTCGWDEYQATSA